MKNSHHSHLKATNIKAQSGLSLLEILITILIITIGSLGMASLQLTGLKYSSGSNTRTQASLLATSMMDRIRANKQYAIDTGNKYKLASFENNSSASKDCHVSECTAKEIAEFDVSKWLSNISRLIPSGKGKIEINNSTTTPIETTMKISIQWRQAMNHEINPGSSSTLESELKSITYQSAI